MDADYSGIALLGAIYPDYVEEVDQYGGDQPRNFVKLLRKLQDLGPPLDAPSTLVVAAQHPNIPDFGTALNKAFSATYLDPHNMVQFYCKKLFNMMDDWVDNCDQFMAPYTSVVTSSMMGKSRLIKEIAMKIPMIYICVREGSALPYVDGYPNRSSSILR